MCFHRKLLVSLRRTLIREPGVWQVQQVLLGIRFFGFKRGCVRTDMHVCVFERRADVGGRVHLIAVTPNHTQAKLLSEKDAVYVWT